MSKPYLMDVYLGRGPGCYNRPGTKKYRSIIKHYAQEFCPKAPRSQKSTFVANLWHKMNEEGYRFFVLSGSEDQNVWVEASHFEVKQRIGHALRDYRKLHFEGKTSRESNSPAVVRRKECPRDKNPKVTNNTRKCADPRKMITLESEETLEKQQDNLHDDGPSPTYEDFCHWQRVLKETNNCDVMNAFLSEGKDWYNEDESSNSSAKGKVSCNSDTLSNNRESFSPMDSSHLVSLKELDKHSKAFSYAKCGEDFAYSSGTDTTRTSISPLLWDDDEDCSSLMTFHSH